MSITVQEIKKILIENNVEYLYHANTVLTSITFLKQGGLMSRGLVEEMGLCQTSQKTDELDKKLGVYYDIFFDSDDIHSRAKDINYYGPVTFVYSIDILDILNDKEVKVTRNNPLYWNISIPKDKYYFDDIYSMRREYHKGDFKQHLTICNFHQPLSFSPYLVKVIIENPNIKNTEYFNRAFNTIQELLYSNQLDVKLEVRQCPSDCKCQEKYKNYKIGFTHYRFKTSI